VTTAPVRRAVCAARRRPPREESRRRLEEADRAGVGGISAWLEFRRGALRLAVGNYTDDAIFDWTARVVPSGHMQVAASISVLDHDASPLRPRRVLRVPLDADDGTEQARGGGPRVQAGTRVETNHPARYVALRFVDSVGREWLRANAQLTRLADRQGRR